MKINTPLRNIRFQLLLFFLLISYKGFSQLSVGIYKDTVIAQGNVGGCDSCTMFFGIHGTFPEITGMETRFYIVWGIGIIDGDTVSGGGYVVMHDSTNYTLLTTSGVGFTLRLVGTPQIPNEYYQCETYTEIEYCLTPPPPEIRALITCDPSGSCYWNACGSISFYPAFTGSYWDSTGFHYEWDSCFVCPGTLTQVGFDWYTTDSLEYDTTTFVFGEATHFIDTSHYAVSWHWTFGDGDTSNLQNPVHIYPFPPPSHYTVCLTISDRCGTTRTYCRNIYIWCNQGYFNAPSTICENDTGILLTASPTGGTFSGPGITGNIFEPLIAGPGMQTLNYHYLYRTSSRHCLYNLYDSIYVNPVYMNNQTITICEGDSVYFQGGYLHDAGVYSDSLQTIQSCDSVFTLSLIINPSYHDEQNISMCEGDSAYFLGNYLFSNGVYYDSLQTSNGCDSIFIMNLTVNPRVIYQSISICRGDSINLSGNYQFYSGTYYDSLQYLSGCDSIIVTTLIVNGGYFVNQGISICSGDSVFVGGHYQLETGIYYDSLQTIGGCDSIIETTVSLNPSYESHQVITICANDSVNFNGNYISQEGFYFDSLQTFFGCDSVFTLQLTVRPDYHISQNLSICNGDSSYAGGSYQYSPGVYYDSLQSHLGCDSIITTNLNVISVITNVHSNYDTLVCENTTALYQWIDCIDSSLINGEINQIFVPASNGNYAVIVGENGCLDTSACYLVLNVEISENFSKNGLMVYPNPTKSTLTIEANSTNPLHQLIIYSADGRMLKSISNIQSSVFNIDMKDFSAGIYFFNCIGEKGAEMVRVVKY